MPLDKVACYGAGWQIHAENLAAHLAGREPDYTEARWDELVAVSAPGGRPRLDAQPGIAPGDARRDSRRGDHVRKRR